MALRRLVVPVLTTAALVATLSPATPASAQTVWKPPRTLANEAGQGELVVGGHESGRAAAVWAGSRAAVRRPNGSWSVRRVAGLPNEYPSYFGRDLVVDKDGRATVAWTWDDDFCDVGSGVPGDFFVETLQFSLNRRLSRDSFYGGENCLGQGVDLAVDDQGTVTAGWPDASWRSGSLMTSMRRPAEAGWDRPAEVHSVRSSTPLVLSPRTGQGLFVWRERSSRPTPTNGVRAALRKGGHSVGKPHQLFRGTALEPVADVDLNGGVVVAGVMRRGPADDRRYVLMTVERTPSGRWLQPQEVAEVPNGKTAFADLKVAAHRNTDTLAWVTVNASGTRQVHAATENADGTWDEPQPLSEELDGAVEVQLDAARSGTALAWAVSTDDGQGAASARLRRRGGTWSQAHLLTNSGVSVRELRLLGHGPAAFTAVYRRGNAVQYTDFGDDVAVPRVRLRKPAPPAELDRWMPVAWTATDDLAGVRNVDVRMRIAGRNGHWSPWRLWLNDVTRASAKRRVAPARTYCFSARGRDRTGKVGPWSPARCAAAPNDDRAAKATAGWRRVGNRRAYEQTLTTTRKRGQRLTLKGVRARQFSLVARSCPRCGVVSVKQGSRLLGRVNLRSAKVRAKRIYKLRTYQRVKAGPVVVRVVSSGKPIQIDGLVTRR